MAVNSVAFSFTSAQEDETPFICLEVQMLLLKSMLNDYFGASSVFHSQAQQYTDKQMLFIASCAIMSPTPHIIVLRTMLCMFYLPEPTRALQ